MTAAHTKGRVWIWLGRLEPPGLGVFQYVAFKYDGDGPPSSVFAEDFGLDWYDEDFQEAVEANSESCELLELLEGVSYLPSFFSALTDAIQALALSNFNVGVLIYDNEFSFHGETKFARGMTFAGAFPVEVHA